MIVLGEGGVLDVEDRVSPCPEGAVCVWSGIETAQGSWELTSVGVYLKLSSEGGTLPHPAPQRLLSSALEPELLRAEPTGCGYRRVLPETRPETTTPPDPEAGGAANESGELR